MSSRAARERSAPTRKKIVLVFGEDENDREMLRVLIPAIRRLDSRIEKRRAPLILMKNRDDAALKKVAQSLESQIQRDQRLHDVRGVVVHEDCDAVEPAHVALAATIHARLASVGVAVVVAAPAWEMETWLFLWPDAAPALVAQWRRPSRKNTHVGLVQNAKEEYRRAVRPGGGIRCRDYAESDSPRIAAKAAELNLISSPDARSDSFEAFRAELIAALF